MANRLYIDLDKCRACDACEASCSYFYHPFNRGIQYLREIAEFSVKCRQCEEAPCVMSCPADALEKGEDQIVKRYNMRCISCKTCAYACPFGTILPELLPYAASRCDYCLNRLSDGEMPVCTGECPHNAIQYGEFESNDKDFTFLVSEHLIVKAVPWKKEDYV